MGLRDLKYSEKGRIGIAVVSTILIATAILVPITIFTDRSIHGTGNDQSSNAIKTYSYTASAGTTTNGFGLIGIGNGDNEDTIEWLNKNNDAYQDVLTDPEIIDGVSSNSGLGFGNEGVIGSEWKGDNPSLNDLILVDDSSEEETTLPYTKVVDHNYDTVLSVNFKVSASVADVMREHMYGNDNIGTPITPSELNTADLFADKILIDEAKRQQFAVAFGFFNYITYSESVKEAMSYSGYAVDGLIGGVSDTNIFNWWNITFSDSFWAINKINDGSTFQLSVDGSSTVNPAFAIGINTFNDSQARFDLYENLNNSGSGNSWGFDSSIKIPGTIHEPDSSDTASAYTFLGTSSSLQNDYVSDGVEHLTLTNWGYVDSNNDPSDGNSSLITTTSSSGKEIVDIASSVLTPESVLETSIAIDGIPTFFTSSSLKIMNYETGKEETPVGITREGVREAYIYGVSWNELSFSGEIVFDESDIYFIE